MSLDLRARVQASAGRLQQALGSRRPVAAVILGSGWAGVSEGLDAVVDVPYAELPAFPTLSISGHAGVARIGRLGGDTSSPDILLLMGRQHPYEHGNAAAMLGAVQTVAALGVNVLVLTNAAGSLDEGLPPGSLMLIQDHLNLVQRSPLQGLEGSERFVDMSQAYDPALRELAWEAALSAGVSLREGVYAWVMGPQFETPAEIRMLSTLGANAVGMSTVPEAIAARHAGLRVLGLSLITNMAAGLSRVGLSHRQTLDTATEHRDTAQRVLEAILRGITT